MTNSKIRLSNLELLRIISMFFVLIVHANFKVLGVPSYEIIKNNPSYALIQIMIESFAIVCVNAFILISGWFGINFKLKSLYSLLFQCAFFLFGIYAFTLLTGIESFTISGLKSCLMLTENVWFVKSYLGLYILAPALNLFTEKADQKNFKILLLSFFIFQSIYGWYSTGATYIEKGYSAFSFIGLYLLARYIRIYQPKFSTWNAKLDIIGYILLSMITSLLLAITCYYNLIGYFYSLLFYTSPFIIMASVFLLLYFSKITFYSKTINWIAASCFSVYLFHFILWEKYMEPSILSLSQNNTGISLLIKISINLIIFFSSAIIIDKIRIYIWNKLISPLL